jgi:hypothetical protein
MKSDFLYISTKQNVGIVEAASTMKIHASPSFRKFVIRKAVISPAII